MNQVSSPAAAGRPSSPSPIRIRNRRKAYLTRHPSYFGPSLELADPLLYDRCIRRFQSAAEREAEGRKKGYSGVLEADLQRSEAKVAALARAGAEKMIYSRGSEGEIFAEEKDDIPESKEEGRERWRQEMEWRFLRGGDEEFDYSTVDASEEWDNRREEERQAEEEWFAEEEEAWVGDEVGKEVNRKTGETGVQDF